MKTTLSTQAYRWREDLGDGSTREHVGRIVQCHTERNAYVITLEYGARLDCDVCGDEEILVQHAHTRELEFVEFGKLSPYPSEPIPEPSAEVQVKA